MRLTFLILPLIISSTVFAQSRKSILKEIETFRSSIYNKAVYQTDSLGLATTINSYFFEQKFSIVQKESLFPLNYFIKTKLSCDDHNYSTSKFDCYVTAFVLITITETSVGKQISITTSTERYKEPFMLGSSTERILGKYKFNRAKLRKYLYLHYYGNKPKLPLAIQNQIAEYNNKQKKEEKKIIEGRDY